MRTSGRRQAGISSRAAGTAFTGLFNRGFDRLAHGYAGAADFVIRHSVVMLVLYAALIGSAGWLLDDHAARLHSGAGSRLRHRLGAVAGRGVAGAHHRDRARDRANCAGYAGHHSRGGIRRLFGCDANAGEQCRGAIPGVRGRGRAPQEGTVREGGREQSAQAAGEHPGRLHHRHPAARGARHRHRRRLHHADPGPPGPRLRNAGGGDRRTGRRGAQGARA